MAAGTTELATAYLSLVPSLRGAADAINKQLGGVDVSKAGAAMGSQLAKSIAPTFGSKVASSLSSLGHTASNVAAKSATMVTAAIAGSPGWHALSGIGTKYLAPIGHAAALAAAKGSAAFSGFAATTGAQFSTLFSRLPPSVQAALSAVGGAFVAFGGKMTSAVSRVVASVGSAIGSIPCNVGKAFSALPGLVGSSIDRVGGAFSHMAGSVKNAATSLGEHIKGALTGAMAVAGAAVVAGMGLITSQIGAAVSRADTLHNFPKIMNNLGYSAEEAAASVKTMSDRLTGLPTSLDQMSGMVQKIAPLTGSLEQATEVSLALNDALLAGGKSTQLQSNAMEQYSQMLSLGKVDMMAWRSMVDAMPGQMNQLAKSILGANATQMDLYNAMKGGKVTFDDFNNAVLKLDKEGTDGFASFAQQSKDATNGIATQWTNLKTAIGRGLAGLVDAVGYSRITGTMSGLTDSINRAFNAINQAVGPMVDSISRKMQELSGAFSSGRFDGIKSIIGPVAAVSAAVGAGGLAGAFDKLGKAVPALAGPLGKLGGPLRALSGPFGILLAAVGALIAQTPELRETFGNTMQTTFETLGVAFAACKPAIDSLIDTFSTTLTAVMPSVSNALNAVIPVIGEIAKVVAKVLPPLANITKVVLPPVAGLILGITAAVKGYSLVVAAVTKAQKAWSVVTKIASAVQVAFNAVLSANPIGIIIMAIAAVVAALTVFFTKTETGKKIWEGFTSTVTRLWENVSSFFTKSMENITEVFHSVLDRVKQAWTNVADWFVGLFKGIQKVVADVWMVLGAVILRPMQLVRDGINTIFSWITSFITKQMSQTSGVMNNVWYGIYRIVQTVWDMISGVVSTAVNAVRTVIVAVLDIIKGDWSGAWDTVSQFFSATWNGIVGYLQPAIDSVKNILGTALSFISNIWNTVWSAIGGFFSTVWSGLVSFFSPVIEWMKNVIGAALSAISDTWNKVWSAISGFFSRIWNDMTKFVSDKVSELGAIVGRIKGVILDALSGAGSWLVDTGRQIIKGLIDGIGGGFKWLKDTITEMGHNIVNWAKDVLNIHSPSRVMRKQVGLMAGLGVAYGLDDSAPIVEKHVRDLSNVIEGSLSFGTEGTVGVAPGVSGSAPSMTVNQELYSLDPDELARKAQQKIAFMLR